jgi:hypothetical protein
VFTNSDGRITFGIEHTFSGSARLEVRTDANEIQLGRWYKVTVSYDGTATPSGVKIYINDVLKTLNTTANTLLTSQDTTTTQPISVGAFLNNSVKIYANAYYKNLSIFDKVLSASEIEDLERSDTSISVSNCVFFSKLDQLNPPDEIGSNNATSFNMDASNIITNDMISVNLTASDKEIDNI